MQSSSVEFQNLLYNDKRNYQLFVDVTLTDGTKLNLTNADIWQGGLTLEDAVSSSDKLDVGSAIINSAKITINNIYDTFSAYDFSDATVRIHVGLVTDEEKGTIEKINKGIYLVDAANYNGSTITLSCLDYMSKFDEPYTNSNLTYPATLGEIVQDACTCCGVALASADFSNRTFQIPERPDDEAVTFREIISYVAQIACCFARVNVNGALELKWYDMSILDDEGLDGQYFDTESDTEYKSGDTADGGTFNPWNTGYVYDAGDFTKMTSYHNIYSYSSLDISTDDTIITGVKVTEKVDSDNSSSKETKEYTSGSDGYVIAIENNPLVNGGIGQTVATYLGKQLIGMRFRKATIQHLSDPTIEAGDVAFFTDRKENTYPIIVSITNFGTNGFQKTISSSETPSKNSSTRYSVATKNYVEQRKDTKQALSSYDQSVQALTNLITQSFGVYKTEETLADGSTVFYLHNKPTLAQSSTQWKMTADAFAVSTDYGKTWKAGMDSNGNAVVNVLSAIGINFEWAKGGMLTLGGNKNVNGVLRILDANGNAIGYWSQSGITANSGDIAGFMINDHKIYAGNSNTGTVVMQKPASNTTWAFAAGGKSHDSYADCPFRVSKSGSLVAKDATIVGDITAHTGSFNAITLNGSNLVNNTMTGSLSGGYYNNGYVSGGTLGYCDLGGTTLSTGNSGYVASDSSSNVTIMGERFAYLRGGKNYLFITSGGTNAMGGNLSVTGKITAQSVTTTKSRAATASVQSLAKSAAMVSVMALEESTKATVNDCGTGTLDENGELEIIIDATLADEVDSSYLPVVFLTKYGEGDIWVDADKLTHDIVMVRGTPNLKFSWLTKYMDAEGSDLEVRAVAEDASGDVDYNTTTMLEYELTSVDEEQSAYNYLIETESLETDYSAEGAAAYEEYEGSLTS